MWNGTEKQEKQQHDQHDECVSTSSQISIKNRVGGTIEVEDYEGRNKACHDLISSLAKVESGLPSTDIAMSHLGASLISMECVLRMLRKDIAGAAEASGVNLPVDFDPESLSVLYRHMTAISGVIGMAVESLRSITGVSMLLAAKDHETGGNPYLIDYFPEIGLLVQMHAELLKYRESRAADPLYQEVVSHFGAASDNSFKNNYENN